MNYDLVIATTTCFVEYGHVKDPNYRRRLFENMLHSYEESLKFGRKILWMKREDQECGWNENYRNLLREAVTMAPICLIADSDGFFSTFWLYVLETIMYSFPDAAGWSLYNSPRLKQYDGKELDEFNFERSHVSPHGLCFRTADYIEPPKGEWFEAFIGELPKKHSMGFVVPKVSLLQHCGMYGLNNLPGASEDFDPEFPFNHECLVNPLDETRHAAQNPVQGEEHAEYSPDQRSID